MSYSFAKRQYESMKVDYGNPNWWKAKALNDAWANYEGSVEFFNDPDNRLLIARQNLTLGQNPDDRIREWRAAYAEQTQAIQQGLDTTWASMEQVCSPGQLVLLSRIKGDWYNEYKYGISDSYSEYMTKWVPRTQPRSLSAAFMPGVVDSPVSLALNVGYSVGYSMFAKGSDDLTRSAADAVSSITQALETVAKLLGTNMARSSGALTRYRSYRSYRAVSAEARSAGRLAESWRGEVETFRVARRAVEIGRWARRAYKVYRVARWFA